jgi:hypothetical protein
MCYTAGFLYFLERELMRKFYNCGLPILMVCFPIIAGFSGCEPDDLSKPVRVHFELKWVEEVQHLPFLTFQNIVVDVKKISFHGIRQEGNDVLFNTRPGDSFGMHILTPSQNTSYLTYFDIQQGVYQLMRWEIELGEIDDDVYPDDFIDSDDFGFIIEGKYTRLNGRTLPLFIAIEEEEIIRMESLSQTGEVPIPILARNVYTVSLEINPHAIMRGIPRSLLEQAEVNEDDDIEFIEISEDENEDLFNLVLFQLSKTLKAVVR